MDLLGSPSNGSRYPRSFHGRFYHETSAVSGNTRDLYSAFRAIHGLPLILIFWYIIRRRLSYIPQESIQPYVSSMKLSSPIFFCLPIFAALAYSSDIRSGVRPIAPLTRRDDEFIGDDRSGSTAFLCSDNSGGCCAIGSSCTEFGNPACT